MSFDKSDVLYQNYLEFMRVFRGNVEDSVEFSSIRSQKKEFRFSVPYSQNGVMSLTTHADAHTILVPTELHSAVANQWKKQGGVTFMTIDRRSPLATAQETTRVASGNNRRIIEDFSVAQCAGFLETAEAHSHWAQWLTEANRKTAGNPDTRFYAAYLDDLPAAGAIALSSSNCVGIYGVATDPRHRKQGLGTLLLEKIIADFKDTEVIGLQVESGSYAHNYYQKLDFENVFELVRFKR